MKKLPRVRNEVIDNVAKWLLSQQDFRVYWDIPEHLLKGQSAADVMSRVVVAKRINSLTRHINAVASDGRAHKVRAVKVISVSTETRGTRLAVRGVLTSKDGKQITVTYPSMRAAEKDGFIGVSIAACLKGKQKTHIGYTWTAL